MSTPKPHNVSFQKQNKSVAPLEIKKDQDFEKQNEHQIEKISDKGSREISRANSFINKPYLVGGLQNQQKNKLKKV